MKSEQIQFQGANFTINADRTIQYGTRQDENSFNDCKGLIDFLNVLKNAGINKSKKNDQSLIVVADDQYVN